MPDVTTKLAEAVRKYAYLLTDSNEDYDLLMELIGEARFVLIGEASHGTHEFYQQRAEITKRLIQEKRFTAVAVEADWPDAYRVNRYVRGESVDTTSEESLRGFQRFPAWMWRNTDVLNFVNWLRQYNDALPQTQPKVGFYGLDLYSLSASIDAVLNYLDQVDPEAAKRARYRYSCFEHYGEDTQAYGYAANLNLTEPCREEVVNQLLELQRQTAKYAKGDGQIAADEFFYAEQNARLVKNAEEYYRAMFHERISSWNLRDRHMAETLDRLFAHLNQQHDDTRIVVWAHNSHLGDARATDMKQIGELNVGQLVREQYDRNAVLIGFTTYTGTVSAASNWGAAVELKRVQPALPESYEALFKSTELPRFMLNLRQDNSAVTGLRQQRLERAIGVIYRPQSERASHYFRACLPDQFDVVIHINDTQAVEPLERTTKGETGEPPETFPSAV